MQSKIIWVLYSYSFLYSWDPVFLPGRIRIWFFSTVVSGFFFLLRPDPQPGLESKLAISPCLFTGLHCADSHNSISYTKIWKFEYFQIHRLHHKYLHLHLYSEYYKIEYLNVQFRIQDPRQQLRVWIPYRPDFFHKCISLDALPTICVSTMHRLRPIDTHLGHYTMLYKYAMSSYSHIFFFHP